MRRFIVECQINANDDRRFVNIQAVDSQQAHVEAQRVVRVQVGVDSNVRGCIVVGIAEA